MTVPVSEVSFLVVSNMKSKVLLDEISVWIHDHVFPCFPCFVCEIGLYLFLCHFLALTHEKLYVVK